MRVPLEKEVPLAPIPPEPTPAEEEPEFPELTEVCARVFICFSISLGIAEGLIN